jgi:hypothetical protein
MCRLIGIFRGSGIGAKSKSESAADANARRRAPTTSKPISNSRSADKKKLTGDDCQRRGGGDRSRA